MSSAAGASSTAGAEERRVRWRAVLVAVLRESRAAGGRLLFFTLCLAIGVAAVVGVSAIIEAMEDGLREESRVLLAADLRVTGRSPLPDSLDGAFGELAFQRSDVRELAAMVSVPARVGDGDAAGPAGSRLVELKVVDERYPFYGELVLAPAGLSTADLDPEAAFVGSDLMAALRLSPGDELMLGGAPFRVAAEVIDEPDRLDFSLTLGPRVFVSHAGLERTNLHVAQSRVRYRALYRLDGPPALGHDELEELEDHIERTVPGSLQVSTHTEAQPSVRRSLRQVEDYLGLVALLSLLLGGIGVAQIVRAWLAGRAQSVAVMRCLGFRAGEVAGLYLGHVALLALAGCLVGGVLGASLPLVVRSLAPDLFPGSGSNLWQPLSMLRGIGLGLFVALLFSLPPLAAVWRVPPAAVLRAEAVPLGAPRGVRIGAPLALLGGVLVSAWLQGGEWDEAAIFSAGLLALAGLLYGAARLVTALVARLPRGSLGPYLENGLAALARPGAGTTGAIVALGLGVMVVLSMLLIERRLAQELRDVLPQDAPSVFLVDVQPDQWDGVRATMEAEGARSIDTVPVVMARLRAIDGISVRELAARGRRRSWTLTREQRLTWMQELPEDNEIVAGELWSDPERFEVSLEEEFAEDLGVGLGTLLRFDVQGVPLEVVVTSLRAVEWRSFAINFFLVVEPGALEEAPHFRIAAARLDQEDQEYALQNELARSFPNVTLLRIRPIIDKVAAVLDRVALGVRGLGSFTVLTGLVILAGAVGTTALRRAREAALLKTLGVTRAGVTRLFAVEYALSGLLAGAIGALGALALAWGFLDHLLEIDPRLPLLAIPLSALATALLATLSGLSASLRALRVRPMETLRG